MRKRADLVLVERGFFASRARAQAAIAAGLVSADGETVRKPSDALAEDARIEASAPHPWASRGGVKLAAALIAFDLDPHGLACLDVGASTAASPTCCSSAARARWSRSTSASGQLDPRLAADPRVSAHEGLDARRLTAEIAGAPEAIVIDVSFISQTLVLPAVLPLAARPAWLVSLVKPQFEVGRDKLVKGAVKDPADLKAACAAVRACVEGLGWTSVGLVPSPIAGGDGAREFLYAARHE